MRDYTIKYFPTDFKQEKVGQFGFIVGLAGLFFTFLVYQMINNYVIKWYFTNKVRNPCAIGISEDVF
jgi:hypothetical protein